MGSPRYCNLMRTVLKVHDMLSRGYFPVEIPPSFSSTDFADRALALKASVPKKDWVKPAELNLARPGLLRRRLSIPNPFSQLELVKKCSTDWLMLESHLIKSQISLSRPKVSAGKLRGLEFRVPMGDRASERLSRMWRGRFVVRADINDFYASIYTHSLEWALHTKAAAKANVGPNSTPTLGGRIDQIVKNGQDGQTKGIPVGPDTSLLLAELILCEIDSQLVAAMPQAASSAIRLVDDIEFYARTRSEAEDFLTAWDSRLHGYDLSLNPKKTEIIEGPVPNEAPWSVILSQFRFRQETDAKLARDMQRFFARAFELTSGYPDDPVLSYAISRVRGLPMDKLSWRTLQHAMLASITAEPSTLRFVAPILGAAFVMGRELDKGRISDTLNQLCWYHAPFEHGSEVAWSLHILRMLALEVDLSAAERIAQMQDNSSLLLLLDFVARKAISGSPDMSAALARASHPLAYRSEDWLLGYEATRNGWIGTKHFSTQSHWQELLKADVSFFRAAPLGNTQPTQISTAPASPGGATQVAATLPTTPTPTPKPSPPSATPAPTPTPKPSPPSTPATPAELKVPPNPSLPAWAKVPVPGWVTLVNPLIEMNDYDAEPGEFY